LSCGLGAHRHLTGEMPKTEFVKMKPEGRNMGICESIDSWTNWSNPAKGSQGDEAPATPGRCRRHASQVQRYLEELKPQLEDSKAMSDSEMERLCQVFESQIDGYLLSLGYALAGLTDFDLDDPESSRQFYAYMGKADWDASSKQLERIAATYESLPCAVRDRMDVPFSAMEQMGLLCSYLSNCTAGFKRSASLENIANSLKDGASGVLRQGA